MLKIVEVKLSFRAMNTDVEVVACIPAGQRDYALQTLYKIQDTFSEIERTLSRFRPDSELSALNASAGLTFKVSPTLFEVVSRALEAARETNGVFDPTILPGLIAAGYDRSFEKLKWSQDTLVARSSFSGVTWHDIFLDKESLTVYLPIGVSLDLGGIGKGWTVDCVCQKLKRFPGYAVDAGGDIRLGGSQANGSPWTIGVDDPLLQGRNLSILGLHETAVCTSTTVKRNWRVNGTQQHHLIDPRSGQPSDSGVIAATVVAASAARAEIAAKSALILGPEAGLKFIESQTDLRGLLVLENGRCLNSSRFQELQLCGVSG